MLCSDWRSYSEDQHHFKEVKLEATCVSPPIDIQQVMQQLCFTRYKKAWTLSRIHVMELQSKKTPSQKYEGRKSRHTNRGHKNLIPNRNVCVCVCFLCI